MPADAAHAVSHSAFLRRGSRRRHRPGAEGRRGRLVHGDECSRRRGGEEAVQRALSVPKTDTAPFHGRESSYSHPHRGAGRSPHVGCRVVQPARYRCPRARGAARRIPVARGGERLSRRLGRGAPGGDLRAPIRHRLQHAPCEGSAEIMGRPAAAAMDRAARHR